MKYYRVKPEYDNKTQYSKRGKYAGIYVGNELYTEKEVERRHLNPGYMELVEVSKKKTYWFFGARFAQSEV
jgi:hypothetical protein